MKHQLSFILWKKDLNKTLVLLLKSYKFVVDFFQVEQFDARLATLVLVHFVLLFQFRYDRSDVKIERGELVCLSQ